MKTLTLHIPDDVNERAQRRAAARGATLDQEIVDLLEGRETAQEEVTLDAARTRMRDLFRSVKGFRLAPVIRREELYDRGSLFTRQHLRESP
jgi:hypothetical protein